MSHIPYFPGGSKIIMAHIHWKLPRIRSESVNNTSKYTRFLPEHKGSKFRLIWLIRKSFSPAKYSSNTVVQYTQGQCLAFLIIALFGTLYCSGLLVTTLHVYDCCDTCRMGTILTSCYPPLSCVGVSQFSAECPESWGGVSCCHGGVQLRTSAPQQSTNSYQPRGKTAL